MKAILYAFFFFACAYCKAQDKKPLTHEVYDGWKSVGEKVISNNGKLIVYAVNPQEGDGMLEMHNIPENKISRAERGYNAVISADSRFVFFKIKPRFKDVRQARIKKKKPEEMPKDSLGLFSVMNDSIQKIPSVKSFRTPGKNGNWLAYLAEKPLRDSLGKKTLPDSLKKKIDGFVKLADSIFRQSLDSVKGKIEKQEVISAAQKAVKEIYK